ncbi:cysteine desulfurase NifS [Anaerobacillus arseniciselenatis]|uniref:cysteine desulfurase n=1 Tax=Anaerobacillus arseniciselenatis TaxID=85682 RepID=A0A1S2LMU4_9BACI|nr:cysteine desulfurase family protein [Anaerobacillus arseniciselenatis]OIJ13832.1 cysteine desulfurase NifS [Anaerobacillus arseniciselenatis]
MKKVYLDYNASTPIASEVREAMLPFFESHYGNPSAMHFEGIQAKQAVENARKQVASLLQCQPNEIIFTSGGSESNNHVLKGVFTTFRNKGNHIITTTIEHPAIMNPCRFLESLGAKVTYVTVDQNGKINPNDIKNAITEETILITVMHSNNEVGTVQPIREIGRLAKKHDILFHTDASQSVGKIPMDVNDLKVDFLTIAGHKLYAPKGIGALYIRGGIEIEPLMHGAGHEGGRRAGTENVVLAVGLGEACELANKSMPRNEDILKLRNYFWDQLQKNFNENIVVNGNLKGILPNTLNVSFLGKIGEEVLAQVPDLAASTGSACHSGKVMLSPVLKAMGITEHVGKGTIRFSLGRYTTKEEIDRAIYLLRTTV